MTTIEIGLLTDNQRLGVSIPNYDNHYRLYFENPEGFVNNQQIGGTGGRNRQQQMFSKVSE